MIWSVGALIWWLYVTITSVGYAFGENFNQLNTIFMNWLLLMSIPFFLIPLTPK